MKVLVTGGAGFIGSHIVECLLAEGHDVIVADNLSTGRLENLKSQIPIYKVDITSGKMKDILAAEQPQVVIHQAAQVDVQYSLKHPVLDAKANILGTINLLDAAVRNNVEKFIYASSCASYGHPLASLVSEDHPKKPISLYGNSKYLGEQCIELFHRLYGLNYFILRYANVYGPRQGHGGEGGVVAIFLKKISRGHAPIIYGDGQQTRDFIYVKDVARANLLALAHGTGEIMNISTGQATSINNLYKMIQKETNFTQPAIYEEKRPGDIERSCLDPSKARRLLGWRAEYSLAQGLRESIQELEL